MADMSKVMEREMLHSEHAAQCFLEAKRRDAKKLERKPTMTARRGPVATLGWENPTGSQGLNRATMPPNATAMRHAAKE